MELEHFNALWQKFSGFLGLFIMIALAVAMLLVSEVNTLQLFFWMHLGFLMLHEYEEYVFPGGFKYFFNHMTVFAVDPPQENIPLGEKMIAVINLGAWVLFTLAALLYEVAPWLGVMMIVFNIVNVVGHLILFQFKKFGYNPGLLTSISLLLPIIILVFDEVIGNDLLSGFEYVLAIVGGIILAASLPISGVLARRQQVS